VLPTPILKFLGIGKPADRHFERPFVYDLSQSSCGMDALDCSLDFVSNLIHMSRSWNRPQPEYMFERIKIPVHRLAASGHRFEATQLPVG
jgi:hypothetical protein